MNMSETAVEVLYCENHPNRETSLRCNRCGKLICAECAIRTPTGYRCSECVRSQQKVFDTTEWYDYPVGFLTGAVLSYLGSLLALRIGFFTLFLAPLAGIAIAEAVRFLVRRRRSPRLFIVTTAGVVLGSLPNLAITLFIGLFGGGFGGIFSLLIQGYYTVMAASGTYTRIGGIRLRR